MRYRVRLSYVGGGWKQVSRTRRAFAHQPGKARRSSLRMSTFVRPSSRNDAVASARPDGDSTSAGGTGTPNRSPAAVTARTPFDVARATSCRSWPSSIPLASRWMSYNQMSRLEA